MSRKKGRLKCLVRDCKRLTMARGLCQSCYACAKRKVDDKVVTWKQLEAAGLAVGKTARGKLAPWSAAYTEALERGARS